MSFSEFTKEDFDLIAREREALMADVKVRCKDESEVAIVQKAFDFANDAHRNVRRRSGAPYIIHPIEVAKIVVNEIGLGCKSITAALLHDVVEDTNYTVDDIRNLFGAKVAQLVDGLTKIKTVLDNEDRNKTSSLHTESLQAENFKRVLLTLGEDARVVLIKLADRLHNCRTIEYMPEHKRDKILSETMYLFIPLAHRLGLYSIKSEMENIWLRFKEPEDYLEISRKIDRNVELRDKQMDEFIAPIKEALDSRGFNYEILKRVKTPYSIWYKMHNKHVAFEEIYDLYAVRIIYEPSISGNIEAERTDAYAILTILTSLYNQLPSRFRNWVLHPKSNGYEALHVTIMSKAGIWVEVQIRSRRMDDIAEKGIAAHWAYKKDGYVTDNNEIDRWLARVQGILESDDLNALELLDIIHKDLVSNDIVVFTPKGDQKTIQNGATALDFAYLIHSHIGEKAIAAKVNRKLAPLSQVLKPGDQVEVITAANAKPKQEWLQFLQTRGARAKVIDFFRNAFEDLAQEGRRIYAKRLEVLGIEDNMEFLKRFLDYENMNESKEFFFRVGLGLIGPEDFRKVASEEKVASSVSGTSRFTSKGDDGTRRYVIADCCKPIPGDPIEGFLIGKDLVMVHHKTCPEAEILASKYGNLVVATEWLDQEREYPVRVSLKGLDRKGLVSELTRCISQGLDMNIRKIMLGGDNGLFEGYVELYVKDKNILSKLVTELKKIDGIQDVVRTDII